MTGKMDGKQLELCDDASVTKLIEEHKQLALKAGVNGTPAYWINNKFINGANIALIESYIGKPKK